MIQRKYLVLAGGPVLVAVLWSAGWFWLAHRIAADLDALAARGGAAPVELAWESVGMSGFPVRLDATLKQPRGLWPAPGRRIEWRGADTVVRFFADGLRTVSFRAPGTHDIDIREGDAVVNVATRSADLRGRLDIDGEGRLAGLRGVAEDVAIRLDGAPSATVERIVFDWSAPAGDPAPDGIHPESAGQSLALVLTGADPGGSRIDPGVPDTLGERVEHLAVAVSIRGDLDPAAADRAALARWRDAGGTLELEHLDIVWGPLRITGNGTLAVDQALQPVGAFSADVAGLDRLVDLLERAGQIRPGQAAIMRIALAVLIRPPAGGGPARARVPVTIQDRLLSVGPVSLLRLPRIDW